MSTKNFLPPHKFYKTLPKKPMSAGALIFNEKKELLLVKPNYKKYWSFPGGIVDGDESPYAACKREVKEETGLEVKDLSLLCVNYLPKDENFGERVQFTFYGGEISNEEQAAIVCGAGEIDECRFVSKEQAIDLFGGRDAKPLKRLHACLNALKKGSVVYMEGGEAR